MGGHGLRNPLADSLEPADVASLMGVVREVLDEAVEMRRQMDLTATALRREANPAILDQAARLAVASDRAGARLASLEAALGRFTAGAQGERQRQQVGFSIIKAQEEERRRLARDIHDGPAQLLANVVFRIEVSQKLLAIDRDRAFAEMEQLKTLVRQSLQDVRKIIFDLRPMALDDLGLLPALRGYLGAFGERSGLNCDLTVQGRERRLAPAAEVAVFRIAQEALNNAWKHADATRVSLTIHFRGEAMELTVADDGVGFDLNAALQRESGFGLVSMRERAGLVGGQLEIDTGQGRGTRVTIVLPAVDGEGGHAA